MNIKQRISALLLTGLLMAGTTLHAAQPQLSFFQRSKNAIAKFFRDIPTAIKWGSALLGGLTLLYVSRSNTKRPSRPTYEDLVNGDGYAATVLPGTGRTYGAKDIPTARGNVHVEQLDVARQNLGMGMCTCGQHAVTQANIIAEALRNNNLNGIRADLRDRQFMGVAVQQTCQEARKLFNENKEGYELHDDDIDAKEGWTEGVIVQLLLRRHAGRFFAGSDQLANDDIAQLNTAGIHRVVLNIGAHWITVVINRPAANALAHYYIADSAGWNDLKNPHVINLINVLERRAAGAPGNGPAHAPVAPGGI